MAIAASGTVSLSDLRAEFVGGSGAISFGDLYRGGSNIRAKAANNTATNLAASVPTSGAIGFGDFHGAAKGFRKTYSETATNQNASSVFGDDYGVDYPKEIVINSGVELGATSTSEEALQADAGLVGSLTITNNGTLTGAGGAVGAAGGDAFEANVACTLVNNGTIRAGGGGGGNGGTGGQGSYTTTSTQTATLTSSGGRSSFGYVGHQNPSQRQKITIPANTAFDIRTQTSISNYNFTWGNLGPTSTGTVMGLCIFCGTDSGSVSNQNYRRENGGFRGPDVVNPNTWTTHSVYSSSYYNGGRWSNSGNDNPRLRMSGNTGGSGAVVSAWGATWVNNSNAQYYAPNSMSAWTILNATQTVTNTNYTNGGSGGSGGVGQGYGQAAGAGAGGAAGGTNAGAGGSGGTGGSYGAAGASGNSGANGNYTNGSGGSGGAAAGNYIRGLSNVTFTNNGVVQGGTA